MPHRQRALAQSASLRLAVRVVVEEQPVPDEFVLQARQLVAQGLGHREACAAFAFTALGNLYPWPAEVVFDRAVQHSGLHRVVVGQDEIAGFGRSVARADIPAIDVGSLAEPQYGIQQGRPVRCAGGC